MLPGAIGMLNDGWIKSLIDDWSRYGVMSWIVVGFLSATFAAGLTTYILLIVWLRRAIRNVSLLVHQPLHGVKSLIQFAIYFVPAMLLLLPYLLKRMYALLAVGFDDQQLELDKGRKRIPERLNAIYIVEAGVVIWIFQLSFYGSGYGSVFQDPDFYILYVVVVIGLVWPIYTSMKEIMRMLQFERQVGHHDCPRCGEPLKKEVAACPMCGFEREHRHQQQVAQAPSTEEKSSHVEN
ncbi:MAG: hypothetical protein CMJ46_12415 [Planctomyces sp.]|nr:hypothetical protein [Planctomyces sp.]